MCVLPDGERRRAIHGAAHRRLSADGEAVRLVGGGEGSADRGGAAAAVGPGGDGARTGGNAHGVSAGGELCGSWRSGTEGSAAGHWVDEEWVCGGGCGGVGEGGRVAVAEAEA